MNKVFISSMGALSSLADNISDTWQAITDGKTGIAPFKDEAMSNWHFNLAAELKQFEPRKKLRDKKILKLISKHDAMGLIAVDEALSQSGLLEYQQSLNEEALKNFNDRSGVYVGSPGNKFAQQYDFLSLAEKGNDMEHFAKELFNQVHPMWLLRILPNNVLAYTGIQYDFKGTNQNVTNHVVSGMQALIEAYHAISLGLCDRAIVVAYDLGFEGQAQMNYGKLGILSDKGLNAFDKSHNGTVLGEGACAILLESEKSLQTRNAKGHVAIQSAFVSADAKGIFSIDEENKSLKKALNGVLDNAKMSVNDLGLVIAHANGNPLSDITEAKALTEIGVSSETKVSGFKWALGHTLAASGLFDVAFATQALKAQKVPGIPSLECPIDEAKDLSLSKNSQHLSKNTAMIINRGFAGMNATIILSHE